MPARRSRRTKKYICTCQQMGESQYWNGFPIGKLMAAYALNFLKRSKKNESGYKFAFMSLQPSQINAIVESIYSPLFASKNRLEDTNYSLLSRYADDPDTIGGEIYEDINAGKVGTALSAYTADIAAALSKNLKYTREETAYIAKLKTELCQMFTITDSDYNIILLCICMQAMEKAYNCVNNYPNHIFIADMLDISYSDVRAALSAGSALIRAGIIEGELHSRSLYEVSALVREYVLGMRKNIIDDTILETSATALLPLENFSIEKQSTAMMTDILRNDGPAHIFLYGKPGTGKTELSRTLSDLSGRTYYLTSLGRSSDSSSSRMQHDRYTTLVAAQSIAARNGAVLIVDEADSILNACSFFNPNPTDKGWLNSFMDRAEAKIIWISNTIGGIDPSTMRRFTYSLYFPDMAIPERVHVLRYQLEHSLLKGILTDDAVERLAAKYEINAGGFTSAVKTAATCFTETTPQPASLRQHRRRTNWNRPSAKRLKNTRSSYMERSAETASAYSTGSRRSTIRQCSTPISLSIASNMS